MKYQHQEVEKRWQKFWQERGTFHASQESKKPKYYVLDMFPYPSGAGLHVGHPLGYIASDIYARYKRHEGFNVLHPQGYDSFGLPAEQYAIQTGQHPAVTTKTNIKRYREQLDNIGFSFDWGREVRTSDPLYYKWTQWIFTELFNSWYNKKSDKAEHIDTLIAQFSAEGNLHIEAVCDEDGASFSAEDWNNFTHKQQQEILLQYRLTYLAETEVNWCPALGTVLANDEIVNGVSERGGHPVVRKKMTQWSMRITAYAQRLLDGLNDIDWPQPLKDTQENWIGKSKGATVEFRVLPPTPSKERGASGAGYLTGGNNSSMLLEKAKEMRKSPTPAESILWDQLKSKQLGVKFRRQHLIDDFIPDFVCLSKKLIIEVDGPIHDQQIEEDASRTEILSGLGYKVIRFKNEEVIGNIDGVVSKISQELKQLPDSEVLPLGEDLGGDSIAVFTTRPDTIFGVTFMTLAPEHELVAKITTLEQKEAVEAYVQATAKRSERERMADVKSITGVFTGAYAEHPFTKEPVPIWIGDYVLAGYGTGAVMAVPCGDQRDYDFAKHFDIPIKNIFKGVDISEEAHAEKHNTYIANSDFLNDLDVKEATQKAIDALEEIGQGYGKINYRLRDTVFSRQRYWGEPFPVYYVDGMPQMIEQQHLPITLPEVEKYLPTEEGEPPLGRADVWAWDTTNNKVVANDKIDHKTIFPLELNTMPGWAGSSWYFFRYMDAHNDAEFASAEALKYWENVDLYIGGSEHGTGHLLYSRFWTKFLKDRGFAPVEEPFKKLINQGMILGESAYTYSIGGFSIDFDHDISKNISEEERQFVSSLKKKYGGIIKNVYVSKELMVFLRKPVIQHPKTEEELSFNERRKELLNTLILDIHNEYSQKGFKNKIVVLAPDQLRKIYKIPVPIDYVDSKNRLDGKSFERWIKNDIRLIAETKEFFVHREVEKMSKSKYNVVNPDDICAAYGADTLRLYEMFLGPLEQAKPWNTAGISGVYGFIKKLWKLYHTGPDGSFYVTDSPPSEGLGEELKTLHKTIKKVKEDIDNFSFNTSVSTFMICVNELTAQKCNNREILEPLAILISPYAPHIAEELWARLRGVDLADLPADYQGISTQPFPVFEEKHLIESTKTYPISFNGKMKFTMDLSLDLSKDQIEEMVMADEKTQQFLNGRTPKKVIVVPGKIVNIVG
ncbi:hypothetical protein GCM10009117_16520 [Gangjinia marincola]|uniref:Leucine--tRNA ligase n=1 Tax=Gangjinia marincola TaxID=578463 RepID=A0ABP3XVQ9_9FLAO